MKKTIAALLLVLTMLFGLCACGKKETVKEEYQSAADFAKLGISLDAPEGSSAQKYNAVESKAGGEDIMIAQVSYTYNDTACVLRCAKVAKHNVSGYDEDKAQSEEQYDLNVENFTSQIRIMQIEGKYVAIWTLGDFSYSLCAETDDQMNATSCAVDAANANVPLAGGGASAATDTTADTASDTTSADTPADTTAADSAVTQTTIAAQ